MKPLLMINSMFQMVEATRGNPDRFGASGSRSQ
jgi:hypothetical protein